jgi:two-component sensor histidine kinase
MALELSEKSNDSTMVAMMLSNIGADNFQLKNYKKSLSNYFSSLKIVSRLASNINIKAQIATDYMNISEVYSLLNKPDSAIYYAKKSVDLNRSNYNKNELAYSFHYLSLAYRCAKNWKQAIVEESGAYSLHLESGDKNGCAESLQGLSEIYFAMGIYQQSLSQAALALTLATKIKAQHIQKDILKIMAQLYYHLNQFKLSNKYWQSYDSLNEILFDKEKLQQIANMEVLYESNKKTKEIESLTQKAIFQELEITQQKRIRNLTLGGIGICLSLLSIIFYQLSLKRKNLLTLAHGKKELEEKNLSLQQLTNKLEKALTDKNFLLKETHHRVKNNLQVISSLLNLQKSNGSPHAIKSAQSRILSMSLIHQRLYKQDNLVGIEFLSYTKELAHLLENLYGFSNHSIKYTITGEDFILNADAAIPLGLILQELITNSFKHAFNGSGDIKINITHIGDGHALILEYGDSGSGMPVEFDIAKSETLGLKLISNLTAQLDGEVTFRNTNGFNVKFVFNNVIACTQQKSVL